MKILAIETATEACSAALLQDGEVISRYEVQARKHSQLILPMMDELLAEAELSLNQLDALAFGRGPGAFTGVRIATGVIQGVAFAADLPVLPISTLTALAQGGYRCFGHSRWMPVYDARMQEVYWNLCELTDEGVMQEVVSASVAKPESIEFDGRVAGIGTGWGSYKEVFADRLGDQVEMMKDGFYCHAEDVATLASIDFVQGKAVSAEQALPIYLRDNVAKKSTKGLGIY